MTFEKFYHPHKYIYISLGSKFNEETVYFDKTAHRTNAPIQLYPMFLMHHGLNPDNEILVVSIDHYDKDNDKGNIESNRQIIKRQNDDNPQVKVILYDKNITVQSMTPLFDFICNVIKDSDPNRCMIANYIRYMHPNHTENYLEQHLPNAILTALSEPFKPRFYQWFGYHPNLYNTIYCYSRNQYLMGFSSFIHILSKTLGSKTLTMMNAQNVFDNILKHPHKKMMCILWNTIVDIEGSIHGDSICPHFNEIVTM